MAIPNVLIGVTGGIAAYKSPGICSGLIKSGYKRLKVVMTKAAEKFITPHTLAVQSKNHVYTDDTWYTQEYPVYHIELTEWLDILLIVPATANTIAKIANGYAPDLLSAIALATPKKKNRIISPVMNTVMLNSKPVQDNLEKLSEDNWKIIPPAEGIMACGSVGKGALPKTSDIITFIKENARNWY